MQSNIQQWYSCFYTFYESHFSRIRHPSHPGRGHGSLTCHMTQFERSDWLRSENYVNIMKEYCFIFLLDISTLNPNPIRFFGLIAEIWFYVLVSNLRTTRFKSYDISVLPLVASRLKHFGHIFKGKQANLIKFPCSNYRRYLKITYVII